MTDKKGNIHVISLVILLLVSVFVIGYFIRQNQQLKRLPQPLISQTDNKTKWKTYSNSFISFKYPENSDWKISEYGDSSLIVNCTKCGPNENVSLFQFAKVNINSIDNYNNRYPKIGERIITNFNSDQAVKEVQPATEQANGSSVVIFVLHHDQGYTLTTRYEGLWGKTDLNDFPNPKPDVLSTFKFLE